MRTVGSSLQRISQPLVAHQYNCTYGHTNSYRAKYKFGRNSKKAWKYIFYFLIDAAIVNAFLLYKVNSTYCTNIERYDKFSFHLKIGHSLIGWFSSRKHDYSWISTLVNNPSNVLMHEYVHINAKWVKRCASHSKVEANTKKFYETIYGCKSCNVHLCKTCHKPFHERK